VSPFAVAWIVADVVALVPAVALLAKRGGRASSEFRSVLTAQLVVIASGVAATAASTPLNAYAEWTLMTAVNIGYALASWRGGLTAHSLATMAIAATALSIGLVLIRTFFSIIVIAIGLVFAIGALFAALLEGRQSRARA
jgi:hypothetical protein